jgi:hypothetical protein
VKAFASTGTIGGTAHLRIATEAWAKYTRYAITVVNQKGKTIGTLDRPVRARGLTQAIDWLVPRGLTAQTLRYSVVAYGPGGKSAKASAALRIKKPVGPTAAGGRR